MVWIHVPVVPAVLETPLSRAALAFARVNLRSSSLAACHKGFDHIYTTGRMHQVGWTHRASALLRSKIPNQNRVTEAPNNGSYPTAVTK